MMNTDGLISVDPWIRIINKDFNSCSIVGQEYIITNKSVEGKYIGGIVVFCDNIQGPGVFLLYLRNIKENPECSKQLYLNNYDKTVNYDHMITLIPARLVRNSYQIYFYS